MRHRGPAYISTGYGILCAALGLISLARASLTKYTGKMIRKSELPLAPRSNRDFLLRRAMQMMIMAKMGVQSVARDTAA